MSASSDLSDIGPAPAMFKTSEGRGRYFAAYDAMLARWPGRINRAILDFLEGE